MATSWDADAVDGSSALSMISLDALYNSLLLSSFLGSRACSGRGFSTFGHDFSRAFLTSLHLFAGFLPFSRQPAQLLHGCGLHTLQYSWPHRGGAMDAASWSAVGACFLTRVEARRGSCFAPGPLGRCLCGFFAGFLAIIYIAIAQELCRSFFGNGGAIMSAFGGGPLKSSELAHGNPLDFQPAHAHERAVAARVLWVRS